MYSDSFIHEKEKYMETERAKKEAAEQPSRAQLQGADCAAKREKYWSELCLEEKVERLRRVLQEANSLSQAAFRRANELGDQFETHDHNQLGHVMTPVRNYLNSPLRGNKGFDPLA